MPAPSHSADAIRPRESLVPAVDAGRSREDRISASGLDACRQLLRALPSGGGVVFILVDRFEFGGGNAIVDMLAGGAIDDAQRKSTNGTQTAPTTEPQPPHARLTNLNDQLQQALGRQLEIASDLQNVLCSIDMATLFLDGSLNIRFFTPAARAIFHVIPGDIGRPLADLSALVRDDALLEDARAVLETLAPRERTVEAHDGSWFARRVLPCRAKDGAVHGVVITYAEITEWRGAADRREPAARQQDMHTPPVRGAAVSAQPAAVISDGVRPPLVLVVESDTRTRNALCEALVQGGLTVRAFSSGEAFLAAYRPGRRACLLVNTRLPGMDGLDLLRKLRSTGDRLPAIVINSAGDVSSAVQAMKAGAADFIVHPVGRDELLAGVARALDLSSDADEALVLQQAAANRLANLTARQREILERILAGQANKNIAADLGISQRTVESHRASIMRKTGSKSLPALARLAFAAALRWTDQPAGFQQRASHARPPAG